MKSILFIVAAFLVIWFYIQPFYKDVDKIVDDMVYTKAERNWDNLEDSLAKEQRKVNDSLEAEMLKLDSTFNRYYLETE